MVVSLSHTACGMHHKIWQAKQKVGATAEWLDFQLRAQDFRNCISKSRLLISPAEWCTIFRVAESICKNRHGFLRQVIRYYQDFCATCLTYGEAGAVDLLLLPLQEGLHAMADLYGFFCITWEGNVGGTAITMRALAVEAFTRHSDSRFSIHSDCDLRACFWNAHLHISAVFNAVTQYFDTIKNSIPHFESQVLPGAVSECSVRTDPLDS